MNNTKKLINELSDEQFRVLYNAIFYPGLDIVLYPLVSEHRWEATAAILGAVEKYDSNDRYKQALNTTLFKFKLEKLLS